MNRFLKSGLTVVSLVALVGLLSSCGVPAAKTPMTSQTHVAIPLNTNTPKASSTVYNDLDAAAIVGALSLARQTPTKAGATLTSFIKALDLNITNLKKSKLDVAVVGNQLIEYSIGKNGSSDAICFSVKPPVVSGAKPGQARWVLYFEPKNGSKSEFVLVQIGLSTCAQAKTYANNLTDAQRLSVSNASRAVIKDAVTKVPASVLTPTGLTLLDEARGIIKAPAAPTPSASK